jgi:ribosomal protein L7/L12
MPDIWNGQDVLILVAAVAAAAFYLGRRSAGLSRDAEAHQTTAPQKSDIGTFERLPEDTRSTVDRLVREGRTIEAVRVVRASTGLGLYEAKQVVDLQRRR